MADGNPPDNPLLALLELEPSGHDRFIGASGEAGEGPPRLFGGHVAAQSLRAALLTVEPARPAHSLHAFFLRPGVPGTPIELTVERTRDGRSFSTRHVTAAQNGEPIFVLTASFHVPEEGDDWQEPGPVDVPGPDDVSTQDSPFSRFSPMTPLDIRPLRSGGSFPILHPLWVRTRQRLPDDPAVHTCVLAFISDMGVVGAARAPDATSMPLAGASLDHAVWFHRPARADDWLLFSAEPVSNAGARGLARGSFRDRRGLLVATVAQEALLRPTKMVPLP